MPEAPRWAAGFYFGFGPTFAVGISRGTSLQLRVLRSGFDLNELPGRSLAGLTWFSGSDLWSGSIYFKGCRHLVFAKIVERRPQNSRLGLPRLRAASRAWRQACGMSMSGQQRQRQASRHEARGPRKASGPPRTASISGLEAAGGSRGVTSEAGLAQESKGRWTAGSSRQ